MTFNLIDAITHVIRIKNQWKNRIVQKIINFRIIIISECQKCFHFRKIFYFVQKFIVDQWKLAVQSLTNDDESIDELFDQFICSVNCLFWRQYQFFCKHLWHYNVVFDLFRKTDWTIWTKMFENNKFEVYETSTKLNREKKKMKKLNRYALQMKKTLNAIKKKYYEIVEHTADWTTEKKNPQMQRWLNWLKKLTESIQNRKMKKTLQKLKKKNH